MIKTSSKVRLIVRLVVFLFLFSLLFSTVSAGIPLSASETSSYKEMRLYPGGMPFGIKFLTAGVVVVGFHRLSDGSENPALQAGLRPADVLLSANGQPLNSAEELNTLVEQSTGKPLSVRYSRDGAEHTATVRPRYSKEEGRYTVGLSVKDSGAGIGTVTFIDPKTNAFAGLGHGICDTDTGELIPMQRGSVVGVTISGVVRGLPGSPGEVKGYFSTGKAGSLLGNSHCGVWGVFAKKPSGVTGEPMALCLRDQLKEGAATILCTVEGSTPTEYSIEISRIDRTCNGNKCFTVKVTDPKLLSKTGGIIQGMSGSPIIQNGRLVGAVTHVLINDPTTGYGIFIENMLNAAQMPMAKAS